MKKGQCNWCGNSPSTDTSVNHYCKRCANLVNDHREDAIKNWDDVVRIAVNRSKANEHRSPKLHIYARVSTPGQAKDGVSLDAQVGTLLRWFHEEREKRNWDAIPEIYRDEGQSSFHLPMLERVEGRKMLAQVASGDTIVIWSVERGFRSSLDFHEARKNLKRMGVTLVVYQLREMDEGPMASAIEAIFAVIAEMDSSIKSERVKAANQQKIAQGEHPFRTSYYKRVRKGTKTVFVPKDEETGKVMRWLYEWWCEGVGVRCAMERVEILLAMEENRWPIERYETERRRRWTESRIRRALYSYRQLTLPPTHEHYQPIEPPDGTGSRDWTGGIKPAKTERGKKIVKETNQLWKDARIARRKANKEARLAGESS